MTSEHPTAAFAPATSDAKVVSIIDVIRSRKVSVGLGRKPERNATEYGDC